MVGLTQVKIMENKEYISRLFKDEVERDGTEYLLKYMDKHGYYSAPASSQYHLSVAGGLAQHSIHVYQNMMKLYYGGKWETLLEYPTTADGVDHESIIITAFLHDFCKMDFYKLSTRNVKENGVWKEVAVYTVDELVPILGHGSKSVIVAQQFVRLYVPEIQAISFHMGLQDSDKVHAGTVSNVFGTVRLALYLHLADIQATFEQDVTCLDLDERGDEEVDGLPF